jgi:zinc transporter, ZIP family
MPPVLRALVATMFTWGVTALGAALVFGIKQVERKLLDAMLAFAAGPCAAAPTSRPSPSWLASPS